MDDPTQPYQPGDAGRPTAPPGYEILGELGRGGMGVVYKVRHVPLNRVVALKVILAGAHATPAHRQRFLAEAQAVARLKHPNVVQVYEVGEHAGLPYFTLEHVPGGSLEDFAAEPLPPRAAAELVERIARGVAHAHAAGLVHRDLKPANVLLEADGTPKVCDFGLAKLIDSDGATATGAVMGTPAYMAPEQAAGEAKRVGPAADVWALGAVLYRLLTGRPPFRGATAWETVRQVTDTPVVPPSKLTSRVPAGLEGVCLRCLRKGPGERYATAEAVADDLGRWLRGEPVAAEPRGGKPWRQTVSAGLAVSVFLTTVIAWRASHTDRPPPVTAATPATGFRDATRDGRAETPATPAKPEPPKPVVPTRPADDGLVPAAVARARAEADTRTALAANNELMRVVDGQLVLRRTKAGQMWPLVGDPEWSDYDVTVKVKGAFGPCIVVRANYPATGGSLQAGLYIAGRNGDRRVSLAWLKNGVPQEVGAQDIKSTLGADTWRVLAVRVRGDTVESYLDGIPMIRHKPQMPNRGMIGLGVTDVGEVRFADLKVTAPDGIVLFKGLPEVRK